MTGERMTVDLLVDVGTSVEPPRSGGGGSRRWVGVLAVTLVALVAALLAWPDGSTTPPPPPDQSAADQRIPVPQAPAPDDPRLLPWPGRGGLVTDEQFVATAVDAWRTQARVSAARDEPGEQVHALWAGFVGSSAVALLQSVGEDGATRVAEVAEARRPGNVQRGPLIVQSVESVSGQPQMLLLGYAGGLDLDDALDRPGLALLQVLPAPDLLGGGVELQRREGSRFVSIGIQPDGLSQPWVHSPTISGDGALVASVRVRGPEPGLRTTQLLTPGRLLPSAAPVRLVAPEWGRTRPDLAEDYVDALAAVQALGRSRGSVAVLGSTPVQDARVGLFEVRRPGRPSQVVTVMTRGTDQDVSQPSPLGDVDEVAVGAVRRPSGHVVVVGVGPPETALMVLGTDGDAVSTGPRVTAAVLDPGSGVREVSAQAYRDDQAWIGRTTLDVRNLR